MEKEKRRDEVTMMALLAIKVDKNQAQLLLRVLTKQGTDPKNCTTPSPTTGI